MNSIGGKNQWTKYYMLRFADDIAVIAEKKEDLQEILRTMEEVLINELEMKINTKKTKFLACNKSSYTEIKIYIERNFKIEQVENFTHL